MGMLRRLCVQAFPSLVYTRGAGDGVCVCGGGGHNGTGHTPKLVGLFGIRYAKGVEVLGASHLLARHWLRHVSDFICHARGVAPRL